ncbi:MAG: type II secretion system protein [Clostridia bacterium]|nr:type II secretion system protein [Clostridia bacterium]
MQKKKGISLIVLVITIIVMIILAASVVISMNNTGIIDKATYAVDLTNENQVQDFASLLWAEAYLDEERTDTIENVVKAGLADNEITDADWNINVTDTGVTVSKKDDTAVSNPNQISFTIEGKTYYADKDMEWGV